MKPKLALLWRVVFGLSILFAAFVGFRIVQAALYLKNHPAQKAPGAEALSQAAKQIVGSSGGVAHGNTAEAQALAARLSRELKVIRETMFEGGKADSIDMQLITKGEFLVYCQLNDESCAFLVHVPEMRRYTDEAKQSIAELAYVSAVTVLDSARKAGVQKLAIATRGNILYDRVLIGDYRFQGKDPLNGARKAEEAGVMAPSLYPFFDSRKNPSSEIAPGAPKASPR